MINPPDLRPGNLIYDNLRQRNVTVLGIEPTWNEVWVRYANGAGDYKVAVYDLDPIPITQELLEKLGFTHRSNHRGEGMMMDFKNDEIQMLVYLEYEKNGGGWRGGHIAGRAKINTLHKLQNIYHDTTDKELEIKL